MAIDAWSVVVVCASVVVVLVSWVVAGPDVVGGEVGGIEAVVGVDRVVVGAGEAADPPQAAAQTTRASAELISLI